MPSGRLNKPGSSRPDRWIFAGLLVLLAWLPLPWGSNSDWARSLFGLAVCGLACARLAMLATGRLPAVSIPRAARIALILTGAWLAWLALQLVPLPAGLLEILSPAAAAIHGAAAQVPGVTPRNSLSILPGASVDRLILTLSYAMLFWLVLTSLRKSRSRQRWVLGVIAFSGVAQALYGSLMTLSGWELGFLEAKRHSQGLATGTFVNRNHFAGYLEVALSAGVALVLADLKPGHAATWRERLSNLVDAALSPRLRMRVLLATMVIALVLSRSRLGNAAFFAALMLCGGLYMLLRHRGLFVRSLALFASFLVVDLFIVSEYYGLQELAQRFESTDLQAEARAQVFRELQPAASEYRWTGAGLGSFAAAYAAHRPGRLQHYLDHAHNDHLQFLVEVGVPGYALLAALALTLVVHGLRIIVRRRDATAAALGFAAPMALCCLAIHGLGDFNFQIPAVAATFIALCGVTFSCSSRGRQRATPEAPAAPAA